MIRRQLAKHNPGVYVPYVGTTLNNIGNLVRADSRSEAEKHYREALVIYRQLAKDNPSNYKSDVAGMLYNLGYLVADDCRRRSEVIKLYQEALDIYRQLEKDNPGVYIPAVANTLTIFGLAYLNWKEPQSALAYFHESAALIEPLAKQAPADFADQHAYLLQLIEQTQRLKR